jgi:hypothetical protein
VPALIAAWKRYRYLRQIARQHPAKDVSKTYVLIDDDAVPPKPIAGNFTLTICEGRARSLPPE